MTKRYLALDHELRRIFGEKTVKLSLNGGFSCPNRENGQGCAFCCGSGAGDFAGDPAQSIKDQISSQIRLLSKKWNTRSYIAYFGTYTSTYAPAERLKQLFNEALSAEGVRGLAIATRPDCIDESTADLLSELSHRTFLWIELGLQTIWDGTHQRLGTGYTYNDYRRAYEMLRERNIRVVPHLIFYLPGETEDMMLESVSAVSSMEPWGIKLHMLYIARSAPLYVMYSEDPFPLPDRDSYTDLIVKALGIIDSRTVIHRLTGDPPLKELFLPLWVRDKRRVLQEIDKKLAARDIYQGKYHCGRNEI